MWPFDKNERRSGEKKKWHPAWLLALAVLGILLIFADNIFHIPVGGRPQTLPVTGSDVGTETFAIQERKGYDDYAANLATEMEEILSQIQGAGRVRVLVTLESGPELEMASNVTENRQTTQEGDTQGGTRTITDYDQTRQVVIVREQTGDEKPVVIREVKPKVLGVLVVAEGAGVSETRARLTDVVTTMLNIPAYRVRVEQKQK